MITLFHLIYRYDINKCYELVIILSSSSSLSPSLNSEQRCLGTDSTVMTFREAAECSKCRQLNESLSEKIEMKKPRLSMFGEIDALSYISKCLIITRCTG